MTTEYIPMQMTWKAAAQIMLMALENGTGEGKEMARKEIMRMADILDDINEERRKASELRDIGELDREEIARKEGRANIGTGNDFLDGTEERR